MILMLLLVLDVGLKVVHHKIKLSKMEVLSIKKYNEKQTAKWNADWEKAKAEGRGWGCMPQLAFYTFQKNYGYVASDGKKALWAKSKKEVLDFWEREEIRKRVRGF